MAASLPDQPDTGSPPWPGIARVLLALGGIEGLLIVTCAVMFAWLETDTAGLHPPGSQYPGWYAYLGVLTLMSATSLGVAARPPFWLRGRPVLVLGGVLVGIGATIVVGATAPQPDGFWFLLLLSWPAWLAGAALSAGPFSLPGI